MSYCRVATFFLVATFVFTMGLWAFPTDMDLVLVDALHESQTEHADQQELHNLAVAGDREKAFDLAFEQGDEL